MTRVSNAVLVTGGAGFIGSNFVLQWIDSIGAALVNLDLFTYAGYPANLLALEGNSQHTLLRGAICDASLVAAALREHQAQAIVHFAAESHVDRSIADSGVIIRTNVQNEPRFAAEASEL